MRYRSGFSKQARFHHLRLIKGLILAIAVGGSAIVFHTSNYSKPIDAKKTNKSCIYCHTQYGSEELTEAGKYYRDKGTLDGYKKK
jgi:nitrate/TMAO reductase-like tetraheme cytochrome c subunit